MMSSDGRQFLGPCIQLPVNIVCDGIGILAAYSPGHALNV